MRGTPFCNIHLDGGRPELVGAPYIGSQHARKHGLYATYVKMDGLEQAMNMLAGDLRVEITIVRHVLAHLLAADLPPVELLDGVVRLSGALVKMLTANRLLVGDGPDELGLDGET